MVYLVRVRVRVRATVRVTARVRVRVRVTVRVELGVPLLDERLRRLDVIELVEGRPLGLLESHRPTRHAPHHLPSEEVAEVPRVHVRHKQVRRIGRYLANSRGVLLRRGGGRHALPPLWAMEVSHVLLERREAAQRWVVERLDAGVGALVEG